MASQMAQVPEEPIVVSPATPGNEVAASPELSASPAHPRMTPVQCVIVALAVTAFLYFARPVILPLVLACMAATALKPVMRGLANLHIPTGPSAVLVFTVLVAALAVGFVQLGRPATRWMDEAPEHMAELKTRVLKLFPNAAKVSRVMATVNDLNVADVGKKDGEKKAPTVEIKDQRGTTSILNWTGTVLAGLGEVLVLIYLILASGDMFMQKLVRVMPTLRDKKRAVDISHEIQTNISNYLFTVSLINLCLGTVTAIGLFMLGIPRPLMWGMLVAIVNFVPYFGPIAGVIFLGIAGILSFDTLFQGLLPAGWYLLLHLLEANFVTPILLGRRFTLNPVAIFVALMFWLWLWGIPGALLAVPILVSVKAICDRLPNASYISELIGR